METRRGRRPARDPFALIDWLWEEERLPEGGRIPSLALFLTGAECPFSCVFCDLWRYTLGGATPPGALPAQVREGLSHAAPLPAPVAAKLYNASNFFDDRAVPPQDDAELAALLAPFSRVTVECHPRLIGERCFAFAERLQGRLEVAMGLETVHPQAFRRLRKGMQLTDFARAAAELRQRRIGVRAFVLLAPPFVPPEDAVTWAVRSVTYAVAQGAEAVSLIPMRSGNEEMEALVAAGDLEPPSLGQLEEALRRCLPAGDAVVTADLWDVERLAGCEVCSQKRLAALRQMNASGQPAADIFCPACGSR